MAQADVSGASLRRTGRARSRPKPKPKPAPRPRSAPRAAMPGDPGFGTGPDARARAPKGSTTSKVKVTKKGRVTQPRYRRPAPADDIDRYLSDRASRLGKDKPNQKIRGNRGPTLEAAGLANLAALGLDAPGFGGNWFTGLARNAAGDLMDIITGAPAGIEWATQTTAWPFLRGFEKITGSGESEITRSIGESARVGAEAVVQDYRTRWVDPLRAAVTEGDFGPLYEQSYQNPVLQALDLAFAKGAIGRAPNAAMRTARALAPESRMAGLVSRRLSELSAPERLGFAQATGRADARNFVPGPGGRYREPIRRTGRPVEPEPGRAPAPTTTVEIPRRYSPDFINRGVQRAADRVRDRVVPKVEAAAQRAQPVPGQQLSGTRKVKAAALRRQTAQAKYDRLQKRRARDVQDVSSAAAETIFANNSASAARAMNRLQPDRTPAGVVRGKQRSLRAEDRPISVEQAAVRLHLDDVLPEAGKLRGGKSAPELRDEWVRTVEGRQTAARNRGQRTDRARQQVQAVRDIPDELLYLTGDSPAVKRVRAAVEEGRKLDEKSQDMSVESGVITETTRREAASRGSALTVGGSRWYTEELGKLANRYGPRITKLRRQVEAAKTPGERRALERRLADTRKAYRGRVAYVKERAIRMTPEIAEQRRVVAAAEAALEVERGRIATRATLEKMYGAGRIAGRGERNVELSPRMRGSRHQPGLPTKGARGKKGDYIPEERSKVKLGWQEYRARRQSRDLAPNAPEGRVPHPPPAPGFRRHGVTAGRAKATRQVLRGQAKKYEVRLKTQGGSARRVEATRKAYDRHMARLKKMEAEARGFLPARRPELVGKRGVYIRDRQVDPIPGSGAPPRGGRFSGPDKAKRSEGRLRGSGRNDMNPELLIHQARRAAENYKGTISAGALDELINTAAYRGPDGKPITGNKKALVSRFDPNRVAWVHKGNLVKALKALDELPEGKWLPDEVVREVVTDQLPDGTRAGDYVAISKDAADVWTQAMTRVPFLDAGLNLWKGGILTLSPRWYINNTFGLALQYAVLSGGDFSGVVKANRINRGIRGGMSRRSPQAIKDTLAEDLVGNRSLPKLMHTGFRINSKLEEFWRRAAYYNRAKGKMRQEGLRVRKMSDQEIVDAIEHMPPAMAESIVRDLDFFIGNYRKFTKFERDLVKRVIPFYSWLRVIARLTFVLPFRSPARAVALHALSVAQEAGLNPTDRALDYFERGALRIPGTDLAIPTWGLNPWQSLAPVLDAVGQKNPFGALIEETIGWTHPLIQFVYSQAAGTNNFGRGIITPPGVAPFGLDPYNSNQVTGRPQRQKVRIGIIEAALQSVAPAQINMIRSAFAGNRTPYGDTTTAQIVADGIDRINGGKGNDKLYMDDKGKRGRTPTAANPYTKLLGTPTYRHDNARVIAEDRKDRARQKQEARELERAGKKG